MVSLPMRTLFATQWIRHPVDSLPKLFTFYQSWALASPVAPLRHCVDDGTTISSTLNAMTLKLKKRRNDAGANTLSQMKFCVIFPLKPSFLCN